MSETTRVIAIVAICIIVTMIERAFPFMIFSKKSVPSIVEYLSKVLPVALMTVLVIYTIRDISFVKLSLFAPQLLGVGFVAIVHLWKKNTLLSIVCGTVFYMILVQMVF